MTDAETKPDPKGEPHDPRLAGELAVLRRLQRSAQATDPDQAARERMRATVLAGLPEILTETAKAARKPKRTTLSAALGRRKPVGARGRLAIALGAAFCLVVALSGMTMLLSNNALPGDPLYGLRQAVESAAMSLTFGDESKGLKHLSYAADRVSDIDSLAARYPDLSDSPAGDYLTALADFDSDATEGTVDLTGFASANGSDVLNQLHGWAVQQSARLGAVKAELPAQAQPGLTHSLALLDRIEARASALLARSSCYTMTSGATDDLGVLPASGPCDRAPADSSVAPLNPSVDPTPTTLPAQQAPLDPNRSTPTTQSGANGVGQVPPPASPPNTTAPAAPPTTPSTPSGPTLPTLPTLPVLPTLSIPFPLPLGEIPPLLPGLPWLKVGA